uniref:Uncharacterized protein n=1 Tax=Amphimedon queenslandica TaxID=400682 RepID=A0A1X7UIY8_AMPQE
MSKLSTVDAEFKFIHLQIIDLIDNEDKLVAQQGVFDDLEDKVSALFLRLHQLTRTLSPSPAPSASLAERTILAKRLHHLEKCINTAKTAITGLPDGLDDLALIAKSEAQLADYKSQLVPIRDELLHSGDVLEDDTLLDLHAELEQQLFDCSHVIHRHLARHDTERTPTTPVASSGVKLPKLDVLVFDGNIINWTKFWQQFRVSVHDRTNITETEKLIYLQHALKVAQLRQ